MAKAVRRAARTPARDARSAQELLDKLLPLAEPGGIEAHQNAAVLEVDDPARLLEMAADPLLCSLLLCRLRPTTALVDRGRADELAEALRRRGQWEGTSSTRTRALQGEGPGE